MVVPTNLRSVESMPHARQWATMLLTDDGLSAISLARKADEKDVVWWLKRSFSVTICVSCWCTSSANMLLLICLCTVTTIGADWIRTLHTKTDLGLSVIFVNWMKRGGRCFIHEGFRSRAALQKSLIWFRISFELF